MSTYTEQPTREVTEAGPTAAPAVPTAVVARKRMSRRGLILSVLVVLLGGVLAYTGASMLITQEQVLVVARDVPAGARITDADLAVASVSRDPSIQTISAAERATVVGQVAQTNLIAGAVLSPGMVGSGSGLSPGSVLVALPLQEGQFPARSLLPGQQVRIVATPGQQQVQPGAAETSDATFDARVVEVGAFNAQSQVTVVDVEVSSADAEAVARLASTGNIAVILIPED